MFVTFRLAGSVPRQMLSRWQRESEALERLLPTLDLKSIAECKKQSVRDRFRELESLLDRPRSGPTWLRDDRVAALVAESLHYRDGRQYRLDAFCIMSSHVHVVVAPLPLPAEGGEYHALSAIMHSLKRRTAREANRLLSRTGSFWAPESFDHYIRDDAEWERIVSYVLNNPVKVGLVEHWPEWKFSYRRE